MSLFSIALKGVPGPWSSPRESSYEVCPLLRKYKRFRHLLKLFMTSECRRQPRRTFLRPLSHSRQEQVRISLVLGTLGHRSCFTDCRPERLVFYRRGGGRGGPRVPLKSLLGKMEDGPPTQLHFPRCQKLNIPLPVIIFVQNDRYVPRGL